MRKLIAISAGVVAGVVAFHFLTPVRRRRLRAAVSRRMLQRMEHMMESLPEDAPPKLVKSVLPRLREQNDQIIAMLREQNGMLREHVQEIPKTVRPREPELR